MRLCEQNGVDLLYVLSTDVATERALSDVFGGS